MWNGAELDFCVTMKLVTVVIVKILNKKSDCYVLERKIRLVERKNYIYIPFLQV